jgi:hypothetical protein
MPICPSARPFKCSSALCISKPNTLLCPIHNCPKYASFLCPDGVCVRNKSSCSHLRLKCKFMDVETGNCLDEDEGENLREIDNCPSYLPIRCQDKDASCRATKEDCPSSVTCPEAFPFFSKYSNEKKNYTRSIKN